MFTTDLVIRLHEIDFTLETQIKEKLIWVTDFNFVKASDEADVVFKRDHFLV